MALLPRPWDALLLLALALAFLVAVHRTLRRLRPGRARRWLGHPLFTMGVAPAALILALFVGPSLVVVGAVSTAWMMHAIAWAATERVRPVRTRPVLVTMGALAATVLLLVGLLVDATRYEKTPPTLAYAFIGTLLAVGVGLASLAATLVPAARRRAPQAALYAALFLPLGFAYVGWSAAALLAVDEEHLGAAAGGVLAAGGGSLLWTSWRAGGPGVLGRWLEPEARLPLVAATALAVAMLAFFMLGDEDGFRRHVAVQRSLQTMGLYVGILGAPLVGATRGAWRAWAARRRGAAPDADGATLP